MGRGNSDSDVRFREMQTGIHATCARINCIEEKEDISDISRIPQQLPATPQTNWMNASLPSFSSQEPINVFNLRADSILIINSVETR